MQPTASCSATWNSLAFEVRLQMWLTRGNIDLTALQDAHWKIIDALEQGNGKRAGELLQKHIFNLPANTSFLPTRIGKTPQQD